MFAEDELDRPVASTILLLADLLVFLLSLVLIVRSLRVNQLPSILYTALFGACVCGLAEARLWNRSWKLHLAFFCLPIVALLSWDLLRWQDFVHEAEASIGMTLTAIPTIVLFGPLCGIALWRKDK